MRWFRTNHRALPWRETRDAYRIWLSEIMLQQTRVESVVPYYRRFLARFPTVAALAAAPLDDVLALWAGLGYYSRARNLHAAARRVLERHGGEFPADSRALRTLPGVGRYTAAAVASIAAGEVAAVVDGNVKRAAARLCAIRDSIDLPATTERIWSIAGALIDPRSPGDSNQALMELGATICLPRTPRCGKCPVRLHCRALAEGAQESLPARRERKATPTVRGVALAVFAGGRILLEKRGERGLLAGLWGLPQVALGEHDDAAAAAGALARSKLRGRVRMTAAIGEVVHVFTHRTLRLGIHAATLARPHRASKTTVWAALDGTDALAKSTLDEKCLALCRAMIAPNTSRPGAARRAGLPVGAAIGEIKEASAASREYRHTATTGFRPRRAERAALPATPSSSR